MLFPNKEREVLEKLEELVSLQNQGRAVRLQDKLGKENFHEVMKKVFEPVTNSVENTFESITKTNIQNSNNINKAIEYINDRILELMIDKGLIAP